MFYKKLPIPGEKNGNRTKQTGEGANGTKARRKRCNRDEGGLRKKVKTWRSRPEKKTHRDEGPAIRRRSVETGDSIGNMRVTKRRHVIFEISGTIRF